MTSLLDRLHRAYRRTGADLPFGDPRRAHGVDMEGYFWRITDATRGRVVVALIGANRDRVGGTWATLGFAAHPGGLLRVEAAEDAYAVEPALGVGSGTAFVADERTVTVDLGPGARLRLEIEQPRLWPGRTFGGSSLFHSVPALNQYWHPWLLGGTVRGEAEIADETWSLDGANVYGEKNWGREGFPDSWWWGQAQGFTEREACVAFAGGEVTAGPLRTEVTALVMRLPSGEVVRLGNPGMSPVRAQVTDTTWELSGRSLSGWQIEVHGAAPLADSHVLPVPLPSERRNTAGALEHLAGRLDVRVSHRKSVVWEGHSELAGLEHGGLDRAEAELRSRGVPLGATHASPGPHRRP